MHMGPFLRNLFSPEILKISNNAIILWYGLKGFTKVFSAPFLTRKNYERRRMPF